MQVGAVTWSAPVTGPSLRLIRPSQPSPCTGGGWELIVAWRQGGNGHTVRHMVVHYRCAISFKVSRNWFAFIITADNVAGTQSAVCEQSAAGTPWGGLIRLPAPCRTFQRAG